MKKSTIRAIAISMVVGALAYGAGAMGSGTHSSNPEGATDTLEEGADAARPNDVPGSLTAEKCTVDVPATAPAPRQAPAAVPAPNQGTVTSTTPAGIIPATESQIDRYSPGDTVTSSNGKTVVFRDGALYDYWEVVN